MKQKKHLRGIKIEHHKNTQFSETEKMPIPPKVYISMAQHLGPPCKPIVAIGDEVKVGQPIATSDAFLSAPVHSSVSGKVEDIKGVRSMMGGEDTLVVIKSDRKQELWEEIKAPVVNSREEFVEAIKQSGLVGLGGAAFPTHIKFNPQNIDEVDTLIVNAAECEPYITADHRLLLEETAEVINGIKLTMNYLQLKKAYIGIESNKMDAIDKINKLLSDEGIKDIEVVVLQSTYPKGAERVLLYEITGKEMKAGVLPAQLGVILSNVATISFVSKYMKDGIPLIIKRLTVDGSAVRTPKNVFVPIGAPIEDVINFCGGYKCPPSKIIMGGPMMGKAIYSDKLPIVKNNNAILAFSIRDGVKPKETACISCGRCYFVCPFDLTPFALYRAYEAKNVTELNRLNVNQCMECGSCAFICPARLPLGFTNKLGKELIKEVKK